MTPISVSTPLSDMSAAGGFESSTLVGKEKRRVRMLVGFMLMPLLGENLFDRLQREPGLTATEAQSMSIGLFKAAVALWERRVVHADLKVRD